MKKFKPRTATQWAKAWTRHNVKALRLRHQGNIFDAETCELQASIAKDFICVNALLNYQFSLITKP
ncbi:MAG: hypothetical protein ACXVP0_13280 [Bacteroidia bacterium]